MIDDSRVIKDEANGLEPAAPRILARQLARPLTDNEIDYVAGGMISRGETVGTFQIESRAQLGDFAGSLHARRLVTIFLCLRPTFWFGLRVADSFGQHLAQLSLRLRRLARCFLLLGHS